MAVKGWPARGEAAWKAAAAASSGGRRVSRVRHFPLRHFPRLARKVFADDSVDDGDEKVAESEH
jgi:hypothetical protein